MSNWREVMLREATAAVRQFCRAHPEFRFEESHPGAKDQLGGGTNFVLWGAHGGETVVYKYYQSDWGAKRYRNELACLQHFAPTGWVPRVHAVEPETLIVMTCLAGRWIQEEVDSGELGVDEIHRLGVQLGRAVGLLVDLEVPHSVEGYSIVSDYEMLPWGSDLEEAVRFYTELCRRDHGQFEAGADPFYGETLSLVEAQTERISGQRQTIYHEDFHCFAHKGELQGFFDVEMARLGTELMQLERVFGCLPDDLRWSSVLEGYEIQTGRGVEAEDYTFMLAMALFYYHIRITRWGKPNSDEDWVANYLPDMRAAARQYAEYVDLRSVLPSL